MGVARSRSMFAVVDWPSNLGLRPSGVEMLPAALRRAGLLEALRARDAASVIPEAAYDPQRNAETGLLNGPALHDAIRALARAIAGVMERSEVPIVLAGDCSVILAGLLAMRTHAPAERTSLLFIDGHADFDEPAVSPTGEVADMDLALATGRGPDLLTTFDGRTPLVHDEDVAAVGARDDDTAIRNTNITLFPLTAIRQKGMSAVADEALAVVTRAQASRFWCHLDADVLDDAIMPAVDYRQPGGLQPAELTELLRRAKDSSRMAGLSVAIYNPALDPSGEGARLLVKILRDAFVD
jgi:arginase